MFRVPALCSGCNEDSAFAELRSEQRKANQEISAMVKNSFVIELPGKL